MNTTLLVSNLATSVDASDLEHIFTIIGDVRSASVVYDKDTGISKGIGYVEMSTREELENCILHFAAQSDGKAIMVRENIPHVPQPPPFKISATKKPAAKIRSPKKSL